MVNTEMAQRIRDILDRMEAAARRSGRDPSSVTLLAVSKTKPLEAVIEAVKTGLVTHFGENHVQEGQIKVPSYPADLPAATWHLIGHLQRNKARKAVSLFDIIESVDSREIASALERICAETGKSMPVLVEVNSSQEASKTGCPMEMADELSEFIRSECPHLFLRGLMTIGPLGGSETDVRRAFASVRELRDRLSFAGSELPVISMGMSGDFEWAIEEGSTEVRVGTSIFGHR